MLCIIEYWDQYLSGKLHVSQELQDLQEEARMLRTEAVEKEKDVVYKEKARDASEGSQRVFFVGYDFDRMMLALTKKDLLIVQP